MMRDRTWRARFGPLFFLLILGLSSLAFGGSAHAAVTGITIHMLGEVPLSTPGGAPIFVAGIWHEVSVNLSAPVGFVAINATLPGATPAGTKTTYRWTWDASTDMWSDPLYGTFIRPDLSWLDGARLTFVIGLDAEATPGLWRLVVFEGTVPVATLDASVEAPLLSYGLSAADFTLQVEPFTGADLSSQPAGQYIRVANQGNVPLRLAVSFDLLQSELSIENPTDVAHIYSDARYYVHLAASPRPPSIIEVQGVSRVEALHVIPSSGAAIINPSVEGTFSLRLQVGRSGYAVKVVGNVVFQTIESVRVDYGAIATWQVFLTGGQSVSLSIATSNARFLGAFTGGQPLSLPATLVLTPDSEYPVTVQVEANQPGSATVTFTIRLLTTGDTQAFTTSILVAGGPPPSDSTFTYLWIVGSIAAALVFGSVIFSQWRHRAAGRTVGRNVASASGGKAKRGYNARRRMRNQRRRNRTNGDGPKGTARSSSTKTTRIR